MDMDTNLLPSPSTSQPFTSINTPNTPTTKNETPEKSSLMLTPKSQVHEDVPLDQTSPINTINTPNTTTMNSTPRKRGRKPGTTTTNGTTPTKKPKKESKTSTGESSSPSSSAAGTAAAAAAAANKCPIQTSFETAGMPDRMILRMRDEEKRPWAEITKAYISLTGAKVGDTTLRMRYHTMKANFVSVTAGDTSLLLRVKKEIEEKFELEKWDRIAEMIEQQGGARYPLATLQKKFKEMSKKGKVEVEVEVDVDVNMADTSAAVAPEGEEDDGEHEEEKEEEEE